jgi:esterase/lipase superfamily enzyme
MPWYGTVRVIQCCSAHRVRREHALVRYVSFNVAPRTGSGGSMPWYGTVRVIQCCSAHRVRREHALVRYVSFNVAPLRTGVLLGAGVSESGACGPTHAI